MEQAQRQGTEPFMDQSPVLAAVMEHAECAGGPVGYAGPAALCFCAVLSGGELSELTRLRHTAAEELHTLRYGEAPLSQGSLADAGTPQ